MIGYEYKVSVSDAVIEEKARGLGMHYEGECKALFERNDKGD